MKPAVATSDGLSVRDLHAAIGDVPVVRGVSLDVRPGEAVGLVGESGSGKSLTALAVADLLPSAVRVTGGSVRLDGTELLGLPARERRSRRGAGIAMIYQDPSTALNPLMTIGAQILEGLAAHGVRGDAAERRMLDALAEVGLPGPDRIAGTHAHQLSGGQRQRAMIAMALALRPRLLIADEPTTALDVTIQKQILELVDELRRNHELGVLWITHDLGVVARIAQRVLVMYAGRIVEDAPANALFRAPAHPYTAGLLGAIPPPRTGARVPLPQIGGTPPDFGQLPPGCPFAPRCPQREPGCTEAEPDLFDRGPGRAACFVPPERWT